MIGRRRNGTPRIPIEQMPRQPRAKRETGEFWRGAKRVGFVLTALGALGGLMIAIASGIAYVEAKADREDLEALRKEQAADRLLERAEAASIKADLAYVKATQEEIKTRLFEFMSAARERLRIPREERRYGHSERTTQE